MIKIDGSISSTVHKRFLYHDDIKATNTLAKPYEIKITQQDLLFSNCSKLVFPTIPSSLLKFTLCKLALAHIYKYIY